LRRKGYRHRISQRIGVGQADREYDFQGRPLAGERGYTVTNDVSIKVDDLASLENVLGSLVEAGANQVQDVTFEVTNPSQYVLRARDEGFRDAEAKARSMAATAGLTILGIERIDPTENYGGGGVNEVLITGSLIAGASSVPISPEPKEFRANVVVVYRVQ
jgi:uncharacterized protein YggE